MQSDNVINFWSNLQSKLSRVKAASVPNGLKTGLLKRRNYVHKALLSRSLECTVVKFRDTSGLLWLPLRPDWQMAKRKWLGRVSLLWQFKI